MYENRSNIEVHNIAFERKNLDWLWISIVFLFSLIFFAKSNQLFLGVLLIGGIVTIYKKSTFKVTTDLLIIWLFSITYYMILLYHGHGGGVGKIIAFMIGPIASFIIGYSIVKAENGFIFKTIMAVVFGNFVHGFLNMMMYFQLYGFTPSITGSRSIPDIWTGVSFTATLQGTYYTLMASLLFYVAVLLINKQRKLLALVIILAIGFSLIATFIMGNRTLVVIMFISFLASFLLYSILTKRNPKSIIKVITYISLFSLLLSFMYTENLLGIREFVEGSTWYFRSDLMVANEDPRLLVYRRAIAQMFDFPFGGYRMDLGLSYAHNLWIDVLYATGLIPFFFLVVYTFKAIKNLRQLLKQENTDTQFKIFIFSIYTGFLLNFMVEPILEGVPYMFISFCLINGMIRKQIDVYKRDNYLRTGGGSNENTLANKYSITRS